MLRTDVPSSQYSPLIGHPLQIRSRHDTPLLSLSKVFVLPERAVPHAKAQLAECGATAQLLDLALSGPSLSRKRHESVMSIVMGS